MLISVIGAGYVGLVTAACLTKLGNHVRRVDIDAHRVESLRLGVVPIHEPGLSELVGEGLASGRLSFHSDSSALRGTELAIVAVGTLTDEEEWTDRVVRRVVLQVARDGQAPSQVVIRSTLLPGTAAIIRARHVN